MSGFLNGKVIEDKSISLDKLSETIEVDTIEVVQDIGDSEEAVVSQKGVSELLFDSFDKSRVRIGDQAEATAERTVSIGSHAEVISRWSVGIGDYACVLVGSATGVGSNCLVEGEGGTAVGVASHAKHSNSVALGYGSVTIASNTVSVGEEDGTRRRITNVGDGVLNNDVVTMRQLNQVKDLIITQVVHVSKDRNVRVGISNNLLVSIDPNYIKLIRENGAKDQVEGVTRYYMNNDDSGYVYFVCSDSALEDLMYIGDLPVNFHLDIVAKVNNEYVRVHGFYSRNGNSVLTVGKVYVGTYDPDTNM